MDENNENENEELEVKPIQPQAVIQKKLVEDNNDSW